MFDWLFGKKTPLPDLNHLYEKSKPIMDEDKQPVDDSIYTMNIIYTNGDRDSFSEIPSEVKSKMFSASRNRFQATYVIGDSLCVNLEHVRKVWFEKVEDNEMSH